MIGDQLTDNENIRPAPESDVPDKSVGDDKVKKKCFDPFAAWVDGPHGKKIHVATFRAIEEAKAEEAALPTRRRVPRTPNPYQR